MYSKPLYITDPVGNNVFSLEERENKKLYVPELKKISSFDEIKLQGDKEKIAFEDFGFDNKLSTNYGLKNFYEIPPLPFRHLPLAGENSNKIANFPPARGKLEGGLGNGITAPIFLFDNHNHALYFWYLARDRELIGDNNILFHVDEHADTRDPGEYLLKPDSLDLQKVFEYTNFSKVNVGNYIIPAQKEGIIGDIVQIRNESNLKDYLDKEDREENIILNLDLDFFQPDLDFIDYDLKKKVVLDIAKKASVITVATSPFFIDQALAIKVFKDIFSTL